MEKIGIGYKRFVEPKKRDLIIFNVADLVNCLPTAAATSSESAVVVPVTMCGYLLFIFYLITLAVSARSYHFHRSFSFHHRRGHLRIGSCCLRSCGFPCHEEPVERFAWLHREPSEDLWPSKRWRTWRKCKQYPEKNILNLLLFIDCYLLVSTSGTSDSVDIVFWVVRVIIVDHELDIINVWKYMLKINPKWTTKLGPLSQQGEPGTMTKLIDKKDNCSEAPLYSSLWQSIQTSKFHYTHQVTGAQNPVHQVESRHSRPPLQLKN